MRFYIILLLVVLILFGCMDLNSDSVELKSPVGLTINGQKQGEWKTYYTNGEVAKIENYRHDTLNGQLFYFDENGKIKVKQFYRMGVKIDSSKIYFSNGQANIEEWKDSSGKVQGLFKLYHINGQLSQIGYMRDNYLDDTCKTFFDNGQLKTVEFYKDRKKEGTWTYFSKEGKSIASEIYSNDILITRRK